MKLLHERTSWCESQLAFDPPDRRVVDWQSRETGLTRRPILIWSVASEVKFSGVFRGGPLVNDDLMLVRELSRRDCSIRRASASPEDEAADVSRVNHASRVSAAMAKTMMDSPLAGACGYDCPYPLLRSHPSAVTSAV